LPPPRTGYKLKVKDVHVEIELCPKGTVSFYENGNQGTGLRVPFSKQNACIACADLDVELGIEDTPAWAHTFAARKGMTQCVPCPGGTIPFTVGGATYQCKACPNGTYRDAYLKRCAPCPACLQVPCSCPAVPPRSLAHPAERCSLALAAPLLLQRHLQGLRRWLRGRPLLQDGLHHVVS
jgi:hypothetical protein